MRVIGMGATLVVAAIAAIGVIVGIRSAPDIKRYMKMRRCEDGISMSEQSGEHLEEEPQEERDRGLARHRVGRTVRRTGRPPRGQRRESTPRSSPTMPRPGAPDLQSGGG